jgi:hypothetical protein
LIRKIFAILFAGIIFFGCDKINDDIVDPDFSVVRVTSVSAPNFVVFSPSDSSLVASIRFENSGNISEVWFKLSSSDGSIVISNFTAMKDDGDSRNGDQAAGDDRYSGKIFLSRSHPYSDYNIEFFVRNLNDRVQKVAVHKFFYDNGQFNADPVIENIFAPDTIVVQDPKSVFVVVAEVTDSNGVNDITNVWFSTLRPDSTSSGARLYLNDLGIDGDEIAGDGKYSIIVEVTPANSKGTYRFDFQAQDRRQSLSEIVSYNITLE